MFDLKGFVLTVLLVYICAPLIAQPPDTAEYAHKTVRFSDFAAKPTGFWLFEPADPIPDSAAVIVFMHGYGALNPMIYGAWIRHIVRQGYTVIYPRFQRNLVFPRPPAFAKKAAKGIRTALDTLAYTEGRVRPLAKQLIYVGHSYGGVISAQLAGLTDQFQLPTTAALFLVAPGSGPLKGGILKDYATLPDGLQIIVTTHGGDWVVGDKIGRRIIDEATTPKRIWLHQQIDSIQGWRAHHNEVYGLDMNFDTGLRNYTSKKALRVGTVDQVDYALFWKPLDLMLSCILNHKNCESLTASALTNWFKGNATNEGLPGIILKVYPNTNEP